MKLQTPTNTFARRSLREISLRTYSFSHQVTWKIHKGNHNVANTLKVAIEKTDNPWQCWNEFVMLMVGGEGTIWQHMLKILWLCASRCSVNGCGWNRRDWFLTVCMCVCVNMGELQKLNLLMVVCRCVGRCVKQRLRDPCTNCMYVCPYPFNEPHNAAGSPSVCCLLIGST